MSRWAILMMQRLLTRRTYSGTGGACGDRQLRFLDKRSNSLLDVDPPSPSYTTPREIELRGSTAAGASRIAGTGDSMLIAANMTTREIACQQRRLAWGEG